MTAPGRPAMQLRMLAAPKLERPMAVVAFPSVGIAGVIGAQFLVEKLNLPLIGSFHSQSLPPTVLVRRGQWEPPVALYGKPYVCGPGGRCKSLLVATSSVPLEGPAVWEASEALWNVFEEQAVELVVVLDSQAVEESVDPTQVFALGLGPSGPALVKAMKRPPLKEGILGGISGALVAGAAAQERDVLVLVTEAHEAHPDSRAAAYLVKVLDDSFVKVGMELDPLVAQAARIEGGIRQTRRAARLSEQRAHESTSRMYG